MLIIKPVSPTRTDVMHLIEQLDAYQSLLYPPESNHLESIDEMSKSNAFFIAAYSGSEICGIGSVKLIDDYGEIKRVYVPSNQRGKRHCQGHNGRIGELSCQAGSYICTP